VTAHFPLWPGDVEAKSKFKAVGGTLFFSASDGLNGEELWKSDGTEAGTLMVRDISPGVLSSSLGGFAAVGNTLYFKRDTGVIQELWKSDGTTDGTVLIKTFSFGFPALSEAAAFGDSLYFRVNDPVTGYELWKTDGTSAGTVLVRDIVPGVGSSLPQSLTVAGGWLYFTKAAPTELWKTDGTLGGTQVVVLPGLAIGGLNYLTAIGNNLYFSASLFRAGQGLWKTDGITTGTVLVKDFCVSPFCGSNPVQLTRAANLLYFIAWDGLPPGTALWRSDGTTSGTFRVADGSADSISINPLWMQVVGPKLFMAAAGPTIGAALWAVDIVPPASTADLNRDAKADLVWHNGATGANTAWLLNVTTAPAVPPVSSAGALAAMADPTWHIACVADMSGDGKADILWRHGKPGDAVDGANQVWLMDGTTRLGVRNISPQADLAWQVAGCGDFDGDGRSDIVWRHGVNGQNKVWLLNVTTNAAVAPLKGFGPLPTLADTTWHIVGVGDTSGDGKADILWRHGLPGEIANGANQVWLMNGVTRTGVRALSTMADLNWQVAGTGDYDGDGKVDIVWRHGASGLNRLWLLDVSTILAQPPVKAIASPPSLADVTWHIVGTGDYNGDGKADLLWRHGLPGETVTTAVGVNQVWLMNGATRLGVRNINAIADLNWQPAR
jgi:ELWxxDGT repeat protein